MEPVRERTIRGTGIIGQPDVASRKLENPIVVPAVLSFLAYGSFGSTVHGLNDFPRDEWPANVELSLLQLPHHGRAGNPPHSHDGVAALLLGAEDSSRHVPCCGLLMLTFPFRNIATTAGWWTAELDDSRGSSTD